MFGFGRTKEKAQAESATVQEYSSARLVELVSDNTELSDLMREYVQLLHYITSGQPTLDDRNQLAEKVKKIHAALATDGKKLMFEPSASDDRVDVSLHNFTRYYEKSYISKH